MIKNFKIEKFTPLVLIFSLVILIISINFFLNYQNSDIKTKELSQSDYLPTLNGNCYYSISEIQEWLNQENIENYRFIYIDELYDETEIEINNIKCFGRISGSSISQNENTNNIGNRVDLIVYPTLILSHILLVFLIGSYKRKSFIIDKKHLSILLLLILFINSFTKYKIYFDSFSWVMSLLLVYYSKDVSSSKKYLQYFICFLFAVNPKNILLIALIVIYFLNFDFKSSKFQYFYFSSLFVYLGSRISDLSYSLRFNNDHYVWIASAMRMDYLNVSEYVAFWDHKGPIILIIYFLLINLFGISNIWVGISISYLALIILVAFLSERILINYFGKHPLIYLSISILTLILTLDPNLGLLKFDTRYLGSVLILIGLYYLLVKNNLRLTTLFLFLATFTVGSFVISQIFICLFIFVNSRFSKKVFLDLLKYNLYWLGIASLYLYTTDQLYEFYILNIYYNLGLGSTNFYYSLSQAIGKSIIPVVVILVSLLFYLKDMKVNKYFVFVIWSIAEIIHVKVTGPRFPDYQVVLYIPLFLASAYLLLENLLNKSERQKKLFSNVLIITLLVSALLSDNIRNYPKNNIGTENLIFGNRIFISENTKNRDYQTVEVIQENLTNYEFGIVLAELDQTKFDAMFKYHLIPSGRAWIYTYHFRSNDESWNNFFSDEYFESSFKEDLEKESPKFAIIESKFNLNDSHMNLLKYYIEPRVLEKECNEKYCLYKLSE